MSTLSELHSHRKTGPRPRLSDKQMVFVDRLMVHGNGTQACIEAGYSPKTAATMATRLESEQYFPLVAAEIRKRREERQALSQAEGRDLAGFLGDVVWADFTQLFSPGDKGGWLITPDAYKKMPIQYRRMVMSVETRRIESADRVTEYVWVEFFSKTVAAVQLARIIYGNSPQGLNGGNQPAPTHTVIDFEQVQREALAVKDANPIEQRIAYAALPAPGRETKLQ